MRKVVISEIWIRGRITGSVDFVSPNVASVFLGSMRPQYMALFVCLFVLFVSFRPKSLRPLLSKVGG